MNYLSVCSGIEAASCAWEPLGWTPIGFAEIEPFPCAVLRHHYPDVPNHGDFTTIDPSSVAHADVLVGGTPCQAFSVAGLRGSLTDARGNLSLAFVRLADAIDDLRLAGGCEPLRILWENVPGVLSTRDNAFGCFLGGLAGHGGPIVTPDGKRWPDAGVVAGPRRVVAWRILDAQWFGVAQRRRRVFVYALGGAGRWAAADALLPLGESLSRDSPSRGTPGKSVAGTLASRTTGGGGLGTDFDLDGGLVAGTVSAKWAKGTGGPSGDECYNLTVGTLCSDTHPGAYSGQDAYTGRLVPVAFDPTQITSRTNGSNPQPGDPCHTLAKGAHAPAVCFEARIARNGRGAPSEIVPPLKAQSGETGKGDGAPLVAYVDVVAKALVSSTGGVDREDKHTLVATFQQPSMTGDVAPCLRSNQYNNSDPSMEAAMMVHSGMVVRRLTPRECERLQGFPDDWTQIPWRKKTADECPDGPRYKACGNSMAVPVIRWLGRRIEATATQGHP